MSLGGWWVGGGGWVGIEPPEGKSQECKIGVSGQQFNESLSNV